MKRTEVKITDKESLANHLIVKHKDRLLLYNYSGYWDEIATLKKLRTSNPAFSQFNDTELFLSFIARASYRIRARPELEWVTSEYPEAYRAMCIFLKNPIHVQMINGTIITREEASIMTSHIDKIEPSTLNLNVNKRNKKILSGIVELISPVLSEGVNLSQKDYLMLAHIIFIRAFSDLSREKERLLLQPLNKEVYARISNYVYPHHFGHAFIEKNRFYYRSICNLFSRVE